MLARALVAAAAILGAAGCAQMPSLLQGSDSGRTHEDMNPLPPLVIVTVPDDIGAGPAPEVKAPAAKPPGPAAPPPPTDIWDRIRRGFQMANLDGPLVREWEQWYASRPEYVRRMVERSSHFLFHVVEEVDRRHMPAEIALLPMIESAYNPQAYSRSHASGIWQFIPSTGKTYGLRQNFWYDGRRDPIAATSAALDYLQNLHGMFSNWELALAAYNWGEGAVGRAIARNQARDLPADYENLTLPAETRNYLPKLQAVKNIVSNPQAFGLELVSIPNRPYFTSVSTDRHIDVRLAARFAGMTVEEFRFLNPAHNKPVIKAHGEERILLPLDRVDAFRSSLATHGEPLVTWQAYTVKRSDRPERIAAKHGMSVARLKEVNGIPAGRKIVAGQTLLVPIQDAVAEPHLPDLPAPALVRTRAHGTPAARKAGKKVVRTRTVQSTQRPETRKATSAKTRSETRRVKQALPAAEPERGVVVAETAGSNSR